MACAAEAKRGRRGEEEVGRRGRSASLLPDELEDEMERGESSSAIVVGDEERRKPRV